MGNAVFEGGCSCGKVRYRAEGDVTSLCYCHCRSCRRAAGAPFVAWGTFPRSTFRITAGDLTTYRSSAEVVRGFCSTCGTPLTYEHARRPQGIDVTLASLDQPGVLRPACHIWVSHRLPWVELGDGLPQYPEWQAAERP
jgi:hypothetical protein